MKNLRAHKNLLYNFFPKNNKAQQLLTDESLRLIIGIICIVGLVAFSVYIVTNAIKNNRELQQAKASLEHLTLEIKNEARQVEILNPGGWFISSWPRVISREVDMPNACSSKGWEKCLCICPHPGRGSKEAAANCDHGACLESDFIINTKTLGDLPNIIYISNPPLFLLVNQEDKTITQGKL